MQSLPESTIEAESLEQGAERVFKFSELLEQLEKMLFVDPIVPESSLSPQEPKYFFFKCDSPAHLKHPPILKLLLDIKKLIGKELAQKLPLIVA